MLAGDFIRAAMAHGHLNGGPNVEPPSGPLIPITANAATASAFLRVDQAVEHFAVQPDLPAAAPDCQQGVVRSIAATTIGHRSGAE